MSLRSLNSAQPPGDIVSTIKSFFLFVAISSPDIFVSFLYRHATRSGHHRVDDISPYTKHGMGARVHPFESLLLTARNGKITLRPFVRIGTANKIKIRR